MKLLIVEDLTIMRRVIANTLKSIGHSDVVEASSGIEALEILSLHPIDLIITDWLMPNMDGLELVKKIREDDYYDDVPIIMLTTRDDKDDVLTAYNAQINGYIIKPFTAQILKDKIDSVAKPFKTYDL